jgi:energy-coupling factor transporter transmembrane protein EcfT
LTTTPIEITDGLETLLNPLKKLNFPVHELALMMSISLRFIPTLMEETDKIMKAQTARGVEYNSGSSVLFSVLRNWRSLWKHEATRVAKDGRNTAS